MAQEQGLFYAAVEDDDDMMEEEDHKDILVEEDEDSHPIFEDIKRGDLEAVQQHVLADRAVLEERQNFERLTPLMCTIWDKKPCIALWLIQHLGPHDLEAADEAGNTALHLASIYGPLRVMQALVAAGADPAPPSPYSITLLMTASEGGYTDIAAFLLQLPAGKATIDHTDEEQETALSLAAFHGHQLIVQLLLDAGADPTIPRGQDSPLHLALSNDRYAIAALLRHAIAMADCARALHKARSLLGAGAASLACLQGRVEQGRALPPLELTTSQQPQQLQLLQLLATAAFAVGVSGGEKGGGLCNELYMELVGYMLPALADKGPAGV